MNESKPKISIIMPSYNHEEYIGFAIDSVISQTYDNWELIIIDDGSKDKSEEIIRKYVDRDKRIKFFKQQNRGVSATMNRAISMAEGAYICFLDSDDAYNSHKLEKQIECIGQGYDLITTKIATIDENNNFTNGSEIEKWFNDFNQKEIFDCNIEKNFLIKNYFCKASIMIKKTYFQEFGLFDEHLITAYDFEFWMRIIKKIKVVRCEEKLTYYRWHGNNETIINNCRMKLEIALIFYRLEMGFLKSINKGSMTIYRHLIDDFLESNGILKFQGVLKNYLSKQPNKELMSFASDEKLLKLMKEYLVKNSNSCLVAKIKKYLITSLKVLKERGIKSLLKRIFEVFRNSRYIKNLIYSKYSFIKLLGRLKYRKKIKQAVDVGNDQNILFLIPWMTIGGGDKVNLDVASHLNKDKITLHFITTNESANEWAAKFKKITPNVFDLTMESQLPFYGLFLQEYFELAKINKVIISNSSVGYDYVQFLKNIFPNVEFMDILHGQGGKNEQGGYPQYSAKFDKYLSKRIVISNYLKKYLIEKFKIEENKIIVIQNGIDENSFDPNKVQPGFVSDFMQTGKEKVISFIGRLSIEKHPEIVVRIADEILNKRKLQNVMFLIAGNGEMKADLQREIDMSNLNQFVHLIGIVDNAANLLRDTDMLLLTSEMEGMPITILEALSMSVPVLATNVGGVSEIIENKKQGFLINYDENIVTAFADKIQLLMECENQSSILKANTRKRIVDNFAIKNSIRKYEQILLD